MTRLIGMVLVAALGLAWPAAAQQELDAARIYLGLTGTTCTLHAASGAPSSGLGAVCDVYHRTDSPYTIYVKTGASTWTAVVQMPSSAAAGDLIAAASATVSARIAAVAAGQVLASNGTGTPPVYTAAPSLTSIGGAANLTLNPAGDLITAPTGNDILPDVGYTKNIGALTNKYLTLHAAELWVETLVAQNTIATIGGRILVGPTTTLTSDFLSASTTLAVKHNQIANGDRLYLEANGKIEFLAVTSGASGSGPYTYTVTRNLDGTGANDWYAGDAVFNTGTTGDGFIDLYSVSGVNAGSTAGPTITGNVRTGTTYSDIATRWAIGNLNGLYGYSGDTYGSGFGDPAHSRLTIDATNGITMTGDSGTMFSMDTSGNALFAGRLTIGTGRNWLGNTEFRNESSTAFGTSVGATSGTSGPQTGVSGTGPSGAGSPNSRYWLASYYSGSGSPSWSWQCNNVSYPSGSGGCGLIETSGGGVPSASSVKNITGPAFAAAPGQYFEFSFYNVTGSPITQVCARIAFYDASGTLIGAVGSNICSTTNPGGGATLANWNRVWGYGVAPANTTWVFPYIETTYSGADATSAIYLTRMYFGEAGAAQTTPTPWAPGGITTVDGSMLQTDLVISNTIRSSGATALGTGTGFWLDATGTPNFRIGVPSGDEFKFDGTNTYLHSANFTVDTSGVTIQPASTSAYSAVSSYRFTVPNQTIGLTGVDDSGSVIGAVRLDSVYTGSSPSTQQNIVTLYAANTTSGTSAKVDVLATGTFATNSVIDMNAASIQLNTTSNGPVLFGSGEVYIPAVNDGTGKIVCIKADSNLGTCNSTSITTSSCTCS